MPIRETTVKFDFQPFLRMKLLTSKFHAVCTACSTITSRNVSETVPFLFMLCVWQTRSIMQVQNYLTPG